MTDSQKPESEAELMLRLQSQFGDLDLSHLLTTNGDSSKNNTEISSEESSLAEPSPEELKAWQESQFQKGKAQKEAQRLDKLGAVQRRREELRQKKNTSSNNLVDDWEQVAAPPDLQGHSSVFFPSSDEDGIEHVGIHPLLQQLAQQGDPDILGTTWKPLFKSADGDGLSFVNLLAKLEAYPGPTVLLMGTMPSANKSLATTENHQKKKKKSGTVGFYTTSPWMESATMAAGSSDCFLFAFNDQDNQVQFFRPNDNNHGSNDHNKKQTYMHYMHGHPSTATSTTKLTAKAKASFANENLLVHGLGIGGSSSLPRLHLTDTLENCRAVDYCSLFEAGDLLLGRAQDSLNYFDVDCIEVWAVGGDEWIQESLLAQQSKKAIMESNRTKARTVNKKHFLQDLVGGILSVDHKPSGFFAHQQGNMHGGGHHVNLDRCDM